MEIDEYQKHAAQTINDHNSDFFIRKLSTEVIEVAQELCWIQGCGEKTFVRQELGDCLRCICQIATLHGIDMSTILKKNLEKMDARAKNNSL